MRAPGMRRLPVGPGRFLGRIVALLVLLATAAFFLPGQVPAGAQQAETWIEAKPMGVGRSGHTSTLLAGPLCVPVARRAWCGKVLVVGGYVASFTALDSTELYDPVSGTWAATKKSDGGVTRLAQARAQHNAVQLLDGSVLVIGGTDGTSPLRSVELYNPDDGTWTGVGDLNFDHRSTGALRGPAVALLQGTAATCGTNCGRVLVVGAFGGGKEVENKAAELYDPTTKSWIPTAPSTFKQDGGSGSHVLSQDPCGTRCGNVLFRGRGVVGVGGAELYDPRAGAWVVTATPSVALVNYSVLLADGRVLFPRGSSGPPAQAYDPTDGEWHTVADNGVGRGRGPLIRLPDGRVLSAGGTTGDSVSASLYSPDPAPTGTWTDTIPLASARTTPSIILLPCAARNGRVLGVGGTQGPSGNPALATAELYDRVPTLQAVTRIAGPAVGGRVPVRLRGLGFHSSQDVQDVQVSFGETLASDVVVKGDGTQIDVKAPITARPVPVTVTVGGIRADTCGPPPLFTTAACPTTAEVGLGA
ncbi:MAG: kelch repeat-containing protein, partial [Acidimicrobiales bacterium]